MKMALKSILSLQLGEVNTDKGRILWDGDEDLKAGDEVFVPVEDSDEPQVAPDGEYVTEDGKTIVVADGKVAEIKDPEAEVADEPESEGDQVESGITAEEQEPEAEPADEEEVADEVTIEDRVASLEARLAEFVEGLNQIVNAIAALEERIAAAEAKLASVEAPAADPIDETPSEVEQKKTRLSYLRKDK